MAGIEGQDALTGSGLRLTQLHVTADERHGSLVRCGGLANLLECGDGGHRSNAMHGDARQFPTAIRLPH